MPEHYKMSEGKETPQFLLYGSLVGRPPRDTEVQIVQTIGKVARCYEKWQKESGRVLRARIARTNFVGGTPRKSWPRAGFQITGEINLPRLPSDDEALSLLQGLAFSLGRSLGLLGLTVVYKGKSYEVSWDVDHAFPS